MMQNYSTIEDYLEAFVTAYSADKQFDIDTNDKVLLASIARQTSRGLGLTDRQHLLVKEKLLKYKKQLVDSDLSNFELSLDTLKHPLRAIDRSKTVFLREENNRVDIVVKFPFNKKTIVLINDLSKKYPSHYRSAKGSNEHAFRFYEPILEDVVDSLSERNFHFDSKLKELYTEIKEIKHTPEKFLPTLKNGSLLNVSQSVSKLTEQELGTLTDDNLIKYYDRAIRYGFSKSDVLSFDNYSGLANKIANRSSQKVYLPPKKFDIDQITNSIKELDRFPLIVVLDTNNELLQLTKIYNSFKRYVPSSQQILLDRIENKNDNNFQVNTFIKENKFATWLDSNIKIAYIFQQKLQKLLLKTDWSPVASLQNSSTRLHSYVSVYLESRCDLMLAIDDQPSMFENNYRKNTYEIL
jgi:hypothetical protein